MQNVGFAAVLVAWVNLPNYNRLRVLPRYTFVAVQGRYLFGVLPLVMMLVVHAFASLHNKWGRWSFGVSLSLLLWVGGFPTFLFAGGASSLIDNRALQHEYKRLLHREQDYIHP